MAASPPSLILNTFTGLIQTFTDFLITSIHTILYSRDLLPPSTFITTRKYNYAVPQQRHPKVCAWVIAACSAARTQLLEGIVRRIIFVIYRDDVGIVERWMFDVDDFPVVPKDQASMIFSELSVSLVDIEEQLGATMQYLVFCKAELAPLPEHCTYTVVVELKEMCDPPVGSSQEWTKSEPSLQTGQQIHVPSMVRRIPVRTIEAGRFILKTWVESLSKHNDS